MKNKEIVYVVCMQEFFYSVEWSCSAFATKKGALEECKRLAEMWRRKVEAWHQKFKPRKKPYLKMGKAQGPKGQGGYGVGMNQKKFPWDWVRYRAVYYVQEYELGRETVRNVGLPW